MIRPLAEVEKEAILMAILKCNCDVLAAADRLRLGKTTIYRKLHEWNLPTGRSAEFRLRVGAALTGEKTR